METEAETWRGDFDCPDIHFSNWIYHTNYHTVTRLRPQNRNQVGAGNVKLCLLFELKELYDDPSRECGIAVTGSFQKICREF